MTRPAAPLLDAHFTVDLGDGADTAFAQVMLPRLDLPAGPEPRLILRRAATGALDLYHWCAQERAAPGQAARTVTVSLLSQDARPMMTWRFAQARPASLGYGPLDALSGAVLIETLELAFDQMTIADPRARSEPKP